MRVCLLCPQPLSQPRSASILCLQLAEGLRDRGYVVKPFAPRTGWRRGNLILRFLREAAAVPFLVWRGFRTERYDVIAAYSPPLTMCVTAVVLGLLWRAPVVLWIQDLYPRLTEEIGLVRNKLALSWARYLERALYRWAARVVVIGDGYFDHVVGTGTDPAKVIIIPNWAYQ